MWQNFAKMEWFKTIWKTLHSRGFHEAPSRPANWRKLRQDEVKFIEEHKAVVEGAMIDALGTRKGLYWGVKDQPRGVYLITAENGAQVLIQIEHGTCYIKEVQLLNLT